MKTMNVILVVVSIGVSVLSPLSSFLVWLISRSNDTRLDGKLHKIADSLRLEFRNANSARIQEFDKKLAELAGKIPEPSVPVVKPKRKRTPKRPDRTVKSKKRIAKGLN